MPRFTKEDVDAAVADIKEKIMNLKRALDKCDLLRKKAEIEHHTEASDEEVAAKVDMRINIEWLLHSIEKVKGQGVIAPAISYLTDDLDAISRTTLQCHQYPKLRGLIDTVEFIVCKLSLQELGDETHVDNRFNQDSSDTLG
ncbi:hypothetical protein ACHAPA_008453 [Fusarium lateritium]